MVCDRIAAPTSAGQRSRIIVAVLSEWPVIAAICCALLLRLRRHRHGRDAQVMEVRTDWRLQTRKRDLSQPALPRRVLSQAREVDLFNGVPVVDEAGFALSDRAAAGDGALGALVEAARGRRPAFGMTATIGGSFITQVRAPAAA